MAQPVEFDSRQRVALGHLQDAGQAGEDVGGFVAPGASQRSWPQTCERLELVAGACRLGRWRSGSVRELRCNPSSWSS